MNDYERVARMIRYLEAHRSEQPDLATLAAEAGLSEFHFHRLFTRWAGVTPKEFLQSLTLAQVRQRLRAGTPVLETTLDSGLSGPGRLHDLCVTLEAASPGEIQARGAGWTLRYGFAESPLGQCLVGESPRGVCHLSFVETEEWSELRVDWPAADFERDDAMAAKWIAAIFQSTSPPSAPLRALVRGTAFQIQVWRALLQIPAGQLTSYQQLATSIGKPGAARAVGSAVARNSLAVLIPCHRVIRETGVIGEYRWGHVRKCAAIAREARPSARK